MPTHVGCGKRDDACNCCGEVNWEPEDVVEAIRFLNDEGHIYRAEGALSESAQAKRRYL